MDRAALIACSCASALKSGVASPAPVRICRPIAEAADALASDAKLLEELKTLCDREDEAIYAGGVVAYRPPRHDRQIRAIFGWNATTKDLHTQTTKGDT